MTGLLGGAALGTITGVLFAPQIYAAFKSVRSELAGAIADAEDAATGAYRDATTRAIDAVDDLHEKGRGTYGKVLSVIIKSAEEVEGRATAAAEIAKSVARAASRRS